MLDVEFLLSWAKTKYGENPLLDVIDPSKLAEVYEKETGDNAPVLHQDDKIYEVSLIGFGQSEFRKSARVKIPNNAEAIAVFKNLNAFEVETLFAEHVPNAGWENEDDGFDYMDDLEVAIEEIDDDDFDFDLPIE